MHPLPAAHSNVVAVAATDRKDARAFFEFRFLRSSGRAWLRNLFHCLNKSVIFIAALRWPRHVAGAA
jgi:hypothetical protein